MKATVGDRVREIREALDQKQPKFAQTLTAAAKRLGIDATYDNTQVSKMEVGRREVTLNDAAVIASVDPSKRGKAWLAWGERAEVVEPKISPAQDDPRTTHQTSAARVRRGG